MGRSECITSCPTSLRQQTGTAARALRARVCGVMFTEMKMPHTNNVYGYFTSNTSLVELEKTLKTRLTSVSVFLEKSSFDGTQTIKLQNQQLEFESTKFNNKGVYSFNGAVAGSLPEVIEKVKVLFSVLKHNNYEPKFEIYNSQFECVHEFKPYKFKNECAHCVRSDAGKTRRPF